MLGGCPHSESLSADGGQPIAVEMVRHDQQTITKPCRPTGNFEWRACQLRARGLHVLELDGDTWHGMSLRQRTVHLQAKLVDRSRREPLLTPPGLF